MLATEYLQSDMPIWIATLLVEKYELRKKLAIAKRGKGDRQSFTPYLDLEFS